MKNNSKSLSLNNSKENLRAQTALIPSLKLLNYTNRNGKPLTSISYSRIKIRDTSESTNDRNDRYEAFDRRNEVKNLKKSFEIKQNRINIHTNGNYVNDTNVNVKLINFLNNKSNSKHVNSNSLSYTHTQPNIGAKSFSNIEDLIKKNEKRKLKLSSFIPKVSLLMFNDIKFL